MTVSSRTPEGEPNLCPLCGGLVRIEPARPPRDAPCPHCGQLLWFLETASGVRVHDAANAESVWERLRQLLDGPSGVETAGSSRTWSLREHLGIDSLDRMELVMDLEESFGLALSVAEIEGWKTRVDVLDGIARLVRKKRGPGDQ